MRTRFVIARSARSSRACRGTWQFDVVENTSANGRCYDDEIATLRSQ